MRKLIVLRGVPGSGKSTWLETSGLKPFVLCPDEIRLMYRAPQLTETGRCIPQKDNKKVWALLYDMLEHRMENGDLTIIDGKHTHPRDFKRYIQLAKKYRYKIYVVEFRSPLDIALLWNKKRADYKYVPDEVIERSHKDMSVKLQASLNVVTAKDVPGILSTKHEDLNQYNKIHFIGDLQGCYTVLLKYFEDNPIREDEFYIFVGDLCDRGIENDKVLQFLMPLSHLPNFAWIWGNHEQWLWNWSTDPNAFLPKEFIDGTQPQLEEAGINKKELRKFLLQFQEMMWFEHKDRRFFVSHAGISTLQYNHNLISSLQLVKGVGGYNDPIDDWFSANFEEDTPVYQVHGHRNKQKLPTYAAKHSFSLESEVEFGGELRVLTHIGTGEFDIHEIANNVYNKRIKKKW